MKIFLVVLAMAVVGCKKSSIDHGAVGAAYTRPFSPPPAPPTLSVQGLAVTAAPGAAGQTTITIAGTLRNDGTRTYSSSWVYYQAVISDGRSVTLAAHYDAPFPPTAEWPFSITLSANDPVVLERVDMTALCGLSQQDSSVDVVDRNIDSVFAKTTNAIYVWP